MYDFWERSTVPGGRGDWVYILPYLMQEMSLGGLILPIQLCPFAGNLFKPRVEFIYLVNCRVDTLRISLSERFIFLLFDLTLEYSSALLY